jgi:rare lipoprotein A
MRGLLIGALALALAAPAAAADDEVEAGTDLGSGMASYFSREMAGNRTANGERCDPDTLTAAHRTAPFGSRIRVTSLTTGRSVVVRINDRGPFSGGRVIDLSHAAAREIGMHRTGTARVNLALLED